MNDRRVKVGDVWQYISISGKPSDAGVWLILEGDKTMFHAYNLVTCYYSNCFHTKCADMISGYKLVSRL